MKHFIKNSVLCAVLIFTACGSSNKGITIVPDDAQRKIDILYDGKLFTSYLYPANLEKTVLFPIYTARGTVITRGFPLAPRPFERADHPHHIGAWLNYGDVNGLDFWNNHEVPTEKRQNFGSIRHRKIANIQNGDKQGILDIEADWVDYTEKVLLKEESSFKFSGEGDWRIIDRTTKLTARQEVTFTDNKEGMIAIRMDRAFEEPLERPDVLLDANGKPIKERTLNNDGVNGVYRNSEGFTKGDVWGKPTKWVYLSAEKNGEKISVAIIDHKSNPGHPAYSHARGYGLFSTNNLGAQAFNPDAPKFVLKLNPGQSITFKHRIIVKTGGFLTDSDMNSQFADFNK